MGFGSLLHIDMDVVPSLLNYYLQDVYDPVNNKY